MREATYNITNGEKLTIEYDETAPLPHLWQVYGVEKERESWKKICSKNLLKT